MATKKISELTELTSPAGTEELIVNAGGTSKKIQIDNLGGHTPEGTAVLSTGEAGGTKFLREDGDGTSSWQSISTDPAMGGDLSGTASNAQLVANAVGTTEIANSAVTDAKIAGMSSSKLSGALPAIDGSALTGMAGGKVLQVVSTTITSNVSFGSSAKDAYVDIKSLAITPSATSSKILIIWSFLSHIGGGNYPGIRTQWLRDSTVIYGPTRLESYYGVANGSNSGYGRRGYLSGNYLDSPNTTSAVTYKIQGDNDSGSSSTGTYEGQIVAGSAGANTAITLMEIAG